MLLILSDIQGIYSGPPDLPESRLLDTFRPADVSNIEFGEKSRVGRGGMESKVKVCTSSSLKQVCKEYEGGTLEN